MESIASKSISEFRRISITHRLGKWNDFEIDNKHAILTLDSVAEKIKRHIGLESEVRIISKSISAPGCMNFISRNRYQIEIHPSVIGRDFALVAVLAHEFTHVFLHEKGVYEESLESNERLTDVQCIYLGFGEFMLDSDHSIASCDQSFHNIKYGYLNKDEIAGEAARFAIISNCQKRYLAIKRVCSKMHAINKKCQSNRIWKLKKELIIALLAQNNGAVEMSCPICDQACRIPIIRETVRITCPSCKTKFDR